MSRVFRERIGTWRLNWWQVVMPLGSRLLATYTQSDALDSRYAVVFDLRGL
jgi:hypothetical protein